MMDDKHLPHESQCPHGHTRPEKAGAWKIGYWILGIGSLLWLLVRSGTKPRRLAYPCQRVAAANSVGFLAYLAALLGSATLLRRLKATFTPFRLFLFVVGLLLTVVLQSSVTAPTAPILAASPTLPAWTSDSAVSNVFAITNVPEPQYTLDGGSIPSGVSPAEALHDTGVDALVTLMEAHGDYFYQTTAYPDGLFAADDVIVIKINNQWDGRNGTNSDVLKGVIYRLVQHPENFTGAVIVAENSQGANPDWYNQTGGNNSQFQDQSYQDVVQAFAGQGYHVCLANWDALRATSVDDYDAGDNDAGYVFEDADDTAEEQNHRRLSYPKFDIACNGLNLAVSMKQGLWNGSSFDDTRLKMINLPVLKRHNSAWATIAMKNYLGFITTYDAGVRWVSPGYKHCWLMGQMDNSDTCNTYTNEYGLIGRQMARIRRADLDIVDAIWVNANNNLGPGSVRLDVLLTSRDPFAVDYYASDYILGPLIHAENPTHDYQQAMASTHGGWFRRGLLANVARLRTEGITDTINIDDSMTREEELAQFNAYVADANASAAPTLTLTAPNGGETWTIGDQAQITWTSTNLSGDVHLEYSTDGWHLHLDRPQHPLRKCVGARQQRPHRHHQRHQRRRLHHRRAAPASIAHLDPHRPQRRRELGNRLPATHPLDFYQPLRRRPPRLLHRRLRHRLHHHRCHQGIYTWTVPNTPSESALVRVSSALTATISDTSDAVFTIAIPTGPHTFEDSFKSVSDVNLEGGETITYAIMLYEATSATLRLTDTLPALCTYITGTATVAPPQHGTLKFPDDTHITWSGVVTWGLPVTITFQVQVQGTTMPWAVVNRALISRNGAPPIERTVTSLLNGYHIYLPLVLRTQ